MEHFYPTSSNFSPEEKVPFITNESSKGTYPLFKQNRKAFHFLCSFLLVLTGLCFVPTEVKARANWADNTGYWDAVYNQSDGTILISVRVYVPDYYLTQDGFVDHGHLQYSTDGVNYLDFYNIDYNSGLEEDSRMGARNGADASRTSYKKGDETWLNITLKINDNIKNIKKIRFIDEGGWHVNSAGSDDINGTRDITISPMSSINTRKSEFITVGNQAKAIFGYTKTLNDVDKLSKIQLYNINGISSRFYNAGTSATDTVNISKSDSSYYYKQSVYDGRITATSDIITVPAFTLPKTATATYDPNTYKVTFSWTIDPVSTQKFINDKFIIQVADNDKFTDPKEIKIDYDPSKASYSLNTIDYKVMLTKNMYFRVGRGDVSVSSTNWNIWDIAKSANLNIPFVSLDANKVSLTLQKINNNNTALIKWDPIATAWVTGASFIINRFNNTSKTQTEVKLSKDDYDKGAYTDQQISVCNEYTYTLQVIPPDNTGFTAFAPIQIANTILPTEIGTILNLTASKGYFPDRTELKWSSQGAFDNFIIKRAENNSNHYVQLATVSGSSTSDYQTDDSKGTAGVYYQYMVVGVVNCNNKPVYSKDTLYAIGFRSPTGNIYGRVTYENGQAVQDAAVRLQSNDAAQLGKSVYLDGNSGSYLKLDSLNTPFTDASFTVEAWIKPDEVSPKNQVIFSRGGQYELGFNSTGQLYFSYNGKTVTGPYNNPNNSFVHVAGIHSKDSLFIMLNDLIIDSVANQFAAAANVEKAVYIGSKSTGNNFKGYIDEMRVWNIALRPSLVARDYTRLMSGGENGLVGYWRFDESIKDQFYDASHKGDQYNQNDGSINGNVIHTDSIPSSSQLSLKAYTDSTGNYMISGIPFTGNGTTYSIVPLLGTHQFDPGSVNRLISASSTEFTVDFKDKSSFPVSGSVYYSGGTVPAGKVQFKIDGQYAQQSNGDIIETDDAGNFTIYVPVGTHEVKAIKNNHVFENGGKITDYLHHNLNYQKTISGLRLYDSTTIRFIGRVAGGAIEEAFPLGHSLSTNNLGKQLSITMTLPSGNKYEIYSGSANKGDSTVILKHLLPTNQTDLEKIHKSRIVYQQNKIVIYPDSLTGEFEADLIPEKFIVDNVNATGWPDLLDGKPISLDFSNKFFIQSSGYSYEDSTLVNGGWVVKNYSDTVKYNDSYKFIKRVNPTVNITQVDFSGKELPYFGNSTFASLSFTGKTDTIPLIDLSKKDKAMYLLGYPVFKQNEPYRFKIKAFEEYPFYESIKNDGTPVVAQQNGKDLIFHVPTQDGQVSLFNKLRNGSSDADVRSLNTDGIVIYDFIAGDPDISAKGLKNFSATIQFGAATNINWNWLGTPQMKAYVLGGKMTGTDFVTAGPNQLLMVLRDPPGSRSYSYAENGSTISHTTTYTGTVDQEGDEDFVQKIGIELVTFQGLGFGTIMSNETEDGIGFGVHHEEHYTGSNTKASSTTLTTRYQTSDAPVFVGEAGDVFVGNSTNITYGSTNNITIIKRSEKKASDSLIYQADAGSEYLIVQRTGINFGERFGTLFAYPQQHIEKVLIPNLLNIRNTILLPSTISATEAQAIADRDKKEVYISKLSPGDPLFGKANTDTTAFGADAKNNYFYDGKSYKIYFPATSAYRTDTIMILNQYVNDWITQLADNEKVKLNAALLQNYSFHAGSPVAYSEQTSHDTTRVNSFNIIIAGSITNTAKVDIMKNGFEFKLKESVGTAQGGEFDSTSSTSKDLGFVLASDGTDDYFSVDVKKADDGSFVFLTKGGESACPYEGSTYTRYYQKGAVLNQPTARIEVPKINVDRPVANDVPSSRKASYTLSLRNESEAKLPATFILGYTDTDSIKGATIAIDGTPIGGSGRAVVVKYGQTVTKVLTLTKGPDAMDYNNIPILLHSACQYDPTGYQETIADTVLISAHFIPSCSDIHLKSPVDKWVLNSESPVNANGKRYLPVTIDQFDVTNSLFDHIELQYKSSSSSTWITTMQFFADSAKFTAAQGDKQFITNAAGINYNLVMDDASFNDQNYDVQAVSYCLLSPGNYVTTQSNLVSGVKDTYFPRLFGSPQPANGILGVSDDIRLNFNEQIAAGLLTYSDFQVTGIRNGVQGDHTVSVRLDGKADYVASEFDKNLTGKNITVEMWVLPDKQNNGTLFSQGNINKSMELAFTADNHLQVIMGTKVIESDKPLDYKQGEWANVALVYNAATSAVAAFYNFTEVIHDVTVDKYDGIGHFEFGRSISRQGNLFAGEMHQVEIWSEALTPTSIQLNSLTQLSGSENSLLAYYPMNEGKGNIAFDKAHSSNAKLVGHWNTPAGKSVAFAGAGYVKMNTAAAPVTSEMDYTLGLWFKADSRQANVTLASNGKGDGTDVGGSLNLFSLGFEDGLLTYRNNGYKIQADGNYLDNNWHHVAVAVNRNSGNAQFFVDGLLNKYFDAKNLGGIAAAYTYLGARAWQNKDSTTVTNFDRYYSGNIDEFRIWNTYLNQTLISKNNNTRLNGSELGLKVYYPFEKYIEFQNNKTMAFTLSDMTIQSDPNLTIPDATAVNASENDDMAPIKDRGPVENLQFDYVVNNDALIINMLEAKQAIDKTIVTFKVKNVRDMNGNPIKSPVTWTAYIDQNQLKWSDNSLNLSKDVYAPMQFESYLINSGGNIQNFRLDNLPSWLTAEPATGTVDPKGKQKITFTVNEGLNIGSYDENIYMRNDNNESEALAINLQVKGKQPGWKVDPAAFKYNMSIYGKIRVNHVFSNNAEDMLAAFVNGKCVGVTKNTYNAGNDLWYAFLTIYSDTIRDSNIEFRIWQANTGKAFQVMPSIPVTFINDTIAGTAGNPIIFDGKEMFFQNIALNQNWNWVSFNVINANANDINTALIDGTWHSGDIVKNEELGFDQYSSRSGWVGILKGFNNTSLFMINTANAQTLSISGIAADVTKTPIPLKGNRWSYISYLPQVNMKVKDALAGYNASDEDVIKSQSGFAMYDSRNGWVGNLTYLEPGKGYMFYRKSTPDTTFFYPNLSGSLTNSGGRLMNGIADYRTEQVNELQMPVAGNFNFAENVTVAAIVGNEFELKKGDNILAYVDGTLRGKAPSVQNAVINQGTYFLNISGTTGQSVYFMIERNGEIIAESITPVIFRPNSIIGTVSKPLVIHVRKIMLGVNIYPNPFNSQVNISINLTNWATQQVHEVQVSVYDVTGRLIVSRPKEQINNGIYQAIWNGKTANGTVCPAGVYFINIKVDDLLKVYKVIKG